MTIHCHLDHLRPNCQPVVSPCQEEGSDGLPEPLPALLR
jgi:hypothetical protein